MSRALQGSDGAIATSHGDLKGKEIVNRKTSIVSIQPSYLTQVFLVSALNFNYIR
jgi:hypothetical protein